MKILKRTKGVGVIFDTENIESQTKSDIKPSTNKSLHMNHQTTDHAFLGEYFPESHPIFLNFGGSFYYVV